MVRAILDGSKTQTRRVVKPQAAILTDEMARGFGVQPPAQQNPAVIPCPYGASGDRLWVRETWGYDFAAVHAKLDSDGPFVYRADGDSKDRTLDGRWRPSIHMFRSASRILLEITDVRVQRLQEISTDDCWAEGVPASPDVDPWHQYCDIWESINGARSWDANPWVWAITFRRLQP